MEFGKEYIKVFETEAQYLAFTASTAFIKPNVSYIPGVEIMHYNPLESLSIAVITCDSKTYNGDTQIATNIVVTYNGVTLVENTDYTVTNNEGGINAGNYTFRINGIGNYYGSKNGTFTINKVTPTVVSPVPNVLTYNGSAQELVTAGSTNWGTLKYKVGSDSWSTSVPTRTRGGAYTVYYKVDGNSNINDVPEATVACSINEKPVTAVVTVDPSSYTYDGSAFEPTVTVKDGTTVIDPSEYSVTYSNNTNVGTASVTIYDNVGGDYQVAGSATFTIEKADAAYTAPTAKSLTYNGSGQALLNAGSVTGGTIQYSSDNSTWSTTIPAGTNADTYTSYWRIVGDSNHNDKASASINTTISPKVVNIPTITLSPASYTYNGSACEPIPTVMDDDVTINANEYTVSYTDNINAGTATCTITDKTGGNYTLSGSKTFAIGKVTPTVTAPVVNSLTYDGSAQQLATAGNMNFGTLKYSLDGSSYSTSVPSGTNAGSYAVYYKVDGDSNVNDVAATSISCSIAKADQSAPTATGATTTYNTTATATASGGGGQGSIEWSNGNTQTSVGSKTTKARWSGNSNYNASPYSNEVTLTMNKAAGSVSTAPTNSNPTYGSGGYLCTAGSGTGTMLYKVGSGSYSSTRPTTSGLNAGSYTLYYKASASTNYNESSEARIAVLLAKASQSAPTATGATVWQGSTATATASGGGGQGSIEWSNGNTRTTLGSQSTQARWSGNSNYNASPWSNSVTLTVNDRYAGHEYVDFGLPSGTKWATMNVGASSPTDYGNYYMYGKGAAQYASTSGQSYYNGTENPLAATADTAVQVWGGQWHMPTSAQCQELIDYCAWTKTTSGGTSGYRVSRNAKSIFLPSPGGFDGGEPDSVGTYGWYWTSSPWKYSESAGNLYCDSKKVAEQIRWGGYPVRPVVG